jgi:hypothetical protein
VTSCRSPLEERSPRIVKGRHGCLQGDNAWTARNEHWIMIAAG